MTQDFVDDITQKTLPILTKFGVVRAGIFGSTSRGVDTKDSDVDMLVEAPKNLSILDMIDIQQQLESVLGKEVDLVEYSMLKPRIRDHVLRDEIRIL